MKKVLIGLGALVVLAIAAVLVGPSFVDWNSYKPEIAQRVKEATGRTLAIDGDISLSILPSPTLAVEQVRFANIEGGSAPDMATLDALDVRVALMPLIHGEVQVESVALVRPTIFLELLADGRANWQIDGGATPSDAAAGGSGAGGDGGLDIRLDSVEIHDGTLIYRDGAAGTEERVEALDATITADSLQGPFEIAGSARAHGLPLAFEVSSGVLAQGRAVPVGLRLALRDTEAEARFSGSLRTAAPAADGDGFQLSGKIEAGGPSLARLIAVLSPGAAMPAALADSFALESRVEYAAPLADFPDVTLRLGETMATGSLNVDTGEPIFAKAQLKLNRLDIDKLLSSAAAPAAAQDGTTAAPAATAPTAPAAPAAMPTAGFTLPRNIGGEFELTIDAIGYSGGVVSDARLSAALSDGSIIITRASALLPGGSDLAIAGTIDADGGQPRFAGAVEASSDNFRGMLDWLKLPLPAKVASDRLRKLSMTTRVSATPTTVQIADVDLRLDSSRVTGGIAIALPEPGRRAKPGFGIGLAIDKLNLDGYLGDSVAAAETGAATPADGAAPATPPEAGGAGGLPLGALKPLAAFDANVELRIGSLTYHEQTMQGLHVDGTLQAGNLTLRDLSVKEFAGGNGALSGSFTDLAGSPRFDTEFDLSAGDAARVLQFAGIDFPGRSKLGRLKLGGTLAGGQHDVAYDAAFSVGGIGAEGQAKGKVSGLGAGIPLIDTDLSLRARDAGPLLELAGLAGASEAKLGALSITGTAASGTDDLTYDVSFSLSGVGGAGALAGTITAISSATPQVDTRLDLSVETPAGLLRLAGIDNATAGRLGKLGVAGTMGGGADAMQLDLGLTGLGGTARVNGTISATTPQADAEAGAPAGTTFDLALDLNHPELRQLLAAVAADYKPAGETLGPFHLATKASGSAASATLTDLVMEAGDSRVTGTMSYEAAGAEAARARPMVILALIGSTLDLRGMLPAEAKGKGGGAGGGSGGGSTPWSREPLDLAVLDAADADIDVVADAVILDDMRIDDLKAKLSLRDGILDVTQLAGNSYGGLVDVTGQLAGRGVPSVSGKIVATNLDSGELTKAGFLGSQITGPLNLTAELSTLGLSMAEMVEGLNGTGQIGGTVTVLTQVEQQVGSALLDLLGKEVKQVKGLTDTLGGVFSAFVGSPNTLSGDFVVTNGVVKTENTQLENATARLLAQGSADLGSWTMDMLANLFRLPSDSPYLAVGLNGVLDSPNIKLSGDAISGGAAGGLGGALQQVVPGLSGGGGGTTTKPGSGLGGALQQIVPGLNRKETAPGTPAGSDGGASEAPATQTAPQTGAPAATPAPVEPEAAPTPAPEAAPAPETPAPETTAPEQAPAEAIPDAAPEEAPAETTPQAAPEEPAPTEAAPADVAPSEPAPAEPAPAEPVPSEPAPAEPEPAEPVPSEPAPAEPAPAEPEPAEPEPAEPAPAPEAAPQPAPETMPQPEPEAAPQTEPEPASPDALAPGTTGGEAVEEDDGYIPPAEDEAPADEAPAPDTAPDALPPGDTESPPLTPLPQ